MLPVMFLVTEYCLQAADILARCVLFFLLFASTLTHYMFYYYSPAAMQIRQLEALQGMAKSSQSKVIFVPMQLQTDVVGQLQSGSSGQGGSTSTGAMIANEAGEDTGMAGRAGLLNSVANI
jgi:hypothetical protein